MNKVKVGIIGLGEIAQIIHLPIFETLSDKYEVAALCDISEQLLKEMGEKYKVNNLYTNALELTRQEDLDAVFILNSDEYHAECAISAANHKKHVFIEKPICPTISDAKKIIEARDKNGVQVMIGYMRRYAPAFLQAVEEVKKMEKIDYVRVRDIIGPNSYFIGPTSVVKRYNDIPQEAIADRAQRHDRMLKEAIGDVPQQINTAYCIMCGLSSHDISAMRELVGIPKRVVAATQWNNGLYMNAIFEYDGFNVTFETGLDNQGRFDAHVEVYSPEKSVKVQYNTSYIRHLPVTLTIAETKDNVYSENVLLPSYIDPYTCEINHFYDVVTKGVKPKTPPEDAIEDLKIFKMIIDAMLINRGE